MTVRMWYYLDRQNAQAGPVPEPDLQNLLATGHVHAQTLVWTEGMAQWTPLMQVDACAVRAPVAAALAPTELILLNGDRFAARAGMLGNGNFKLLHTDAGVSYAELCRAMLATVLLMHELQGALRLQIQQRKGLFGLRTVQELFVEPVNLVTPSLPDSLETRLIPILQQGPREVSRVLADLIGKDSGNASAYVVDSVLSRMVERGLLLGNEERKFLGSKVTYQLAAGTPAVVSQYPVEPVQQLLAATQHGRPDLWKHLQAGIKAAISRRTESSDGGDDFDSDYDSGDSGGE